MDEILTDINLILATGEYLFSGVILGFDKGRRKDSAPLKLSGMDDVFKIKYTGVERNMLQNFNAECFTVAGILNYRMQEKLKELAANILKGRTGEQVSRGEENVDPQKLFVERAKGLLDMYQYTGDTPPDGHLKTNYRTATTSAYHGSLWKKMEAAGIYVALQYKTRKDNRVRPEHKLLDDLIYYKDDPIWKTIYPPNSWNCRCYTTPLTIDEITGKEVQSPVRDAEEEKKIITEAGISKEFARNPGMTESIYNKWMDSEMEAVNFSAWFKKAFDYDRSVTKLLTKENLEQILEQNATPYRKIEPTQENWDSEFEDNKCKTALNDLEATFKNDLKIEGKDGTFTSFEKLIELGKKDKRHLHMGLIKPTLQDALIVLKNKRDAIVFLKSFKDDKGRIDFTSVTYQKGDLLEVVSNYDRNRFDKLFEEFKSSEVLLFSALTSKKSGNFSRDTSPALPEGSEPNAKLQKTPDKFNEVWSERKFSKKDDRYYSITRFITYGPDWFQVLTINGSKEGSKLNQLNWDELDSHRSGMLCFQKGFDAWK